MIYRSVLGDYSNPRALVSVAYPRATDLHFTVFGSTQVLDYSGDAQQSSSPQQIVNVSNNPSSYVGANSLAINLEYNTSTADQLLSGVGFRLHYDSSKLSLLSIENNFADGFLTGDYGDFNDTQDFDNNTSTDKYVQLKWLNSSGSNWPSNNVSLPLQLATLNFSVSDDAAARGNTPLNLTPVSTAAGYVFKTDNFPLEISFISWDIDGNGQADALTDGLMYLRYLFGLRGSEFYAGVIEPDVVLSVGEIEANAKTLTETIGDIDGDSQADALTDGLLLLRYLFGLRGDPLVDSAVALNATRTTATQIESYIENFFPVSGSEDTQEDVFIQKANTRAVLDVTQPKSIITSNNIQSFASLTKSSTTVQLPIVEVESNATAVASLLEYLKPKQVLQYVNIVASDLRILLEDLLSESLSSSFGVLDTQNLSVLKKVSDQLNLADVVSVSQASGLIDSFVFGDEATLTAVYSRPRTDTVAVADQPHLNLSKSTLESMLMSELASLLFVKNEADSVGISDSNALAVTSTKQDTAALTDSHSLEYNSNKQDVQATFEIVSRYARFTRGLSDTFRLEDRASTDGGIDKENLFSLGDETFLFGTYNRPRTELITVSELLSNQLTKPFSDNQSTFETFSKNLYFRQAPHDEIDVLDRLSFSGDFVKADSVGLQDVPFLSFSTQTADTQQTIEAVTKFTAYRKAVQSGITIFDDISTDNLTTGLDSFVFGDEATLAVIYKRVHTSTFAIDEQASLSVIKPENDIQAATEVFTSNIYYRESEQDTLAFSDFPTFTISLSKSDLVSFSELTSLSVVKPFYDTQASSESFNRFGSYRRTANDFFHIDDAIDLGSVFGQNKGNVFGVNDEAFLQAAYSRPQTDSFSFGSDTSIDVSKQDTDSQTAIEAFVKYIGYKEIPTDSLAFTEAVALGAVKGLTSEVGVIEQHSLQLTKPFGDAQTAVEAIAKYASFKRALEDTIQLIDSDSLSSSSVSVDSFGFKDEATTEVVYQRPRTSSVQVLELLGLLTSKLETDSVGTFLTFSKYGHYREAVSDTLILSDSDDFTLATDNTDTASISDQASLTFAKPVSDSQNTTETTARFINYTRSASSSFTFIDNTNVSSSSSNASSFSLLEDINTSTIFYRNPTESVDILELVGKQLSKTLNDTQETFEHFVKLIGYRERKVENIGVDDEAFLQSNKYQLANISLSEDVDISTTKTVSEIVTPQESVSQNRYYRRTASSSITLTDEDNLQNVSKPIESVGFIEDVDLIITFLRKPTENISILEAANISLSANKSDTFDASEQLVKNIYYRESFSETIGITDSETIQSALDHSNALSVVDVPSILLSKPASDSVAPSEAVSKFAAHRLVVTDSLGFEEVIDLPYSASATKSDGFGFIEQVTLSTILEVLRTENLGVSDQLNYTLSKPLNNTQNTSENISKLIYYKESASDSIGFSESVTTTLTTTDSSRTVNSSAVNSAEIN